MRGLIKNLLNKSPSKTKQKRDPERLQSETEVARSDNVKERITLAKNTQTHQEILYYLAENDPDPRVRKAVAQNKTTPVHASTILAKDEDLDVRMELVKRLIDLLPTLSQDKHSQLYAYVVQALGDLALDEVLKIRIALSSALKDHANTPPKVAGQLARDLERKVSEPILKFCTALSDEDLLDILKEHPASWSIQAIAGRPEVSPEVSRAVIATDDRPAGTILLSNEGAQITENLLQEIISKAREYPEWQKPISIRKTLPAYLAQELASFAEAAAMQLLAKRGDYDEDTLQDISKAFKRRMDYAQTASKEDQTVVQRVAFLYSKGDLTEETISDALGMRDREFVIAALAQLARCPIQEVSHIFEMKAAKPIVALTWYAGLSMRIAFRFQQELGHVPPKELLYPKGGSEYPLSTEDLNWQLEFLGLKKTKKKKK